MHSFPVGDFSKAVVVTNMSILSLSWRNLLRIGTAEQTTIYICLYNYNIYI